ncbi:MAG: carbohydrate ABC transporter permease [Clostridiaceae bacterium]|jgi:putative aldouronate transport system permease protein|nr:carbohydrate ABC transporter permease [Clostridiaceae bacterium]
MYGSFSRMRKIPIGTIILYIFLAVIVFVCLYPFLNVIAYSLSGYNAVLSGRVTFYPIDFNLSAYKQILGRTQMWVSMRTTVVVTLLGTATSLVLTLFAAYALSRDYLPGKKVFSGLILFTMYFSGGMIPTFLVVKGLGLYDKLGALFIPQAINVFNFIVMRTFFRELPKSLEEAATIDGASETQVLMKVVLPLSMPILATMALFYAVGYWNSYFEALLYIQDPNKYTLQLRLRSLLFGEELNTSGRNIEGVGSEVMAQSLKMATVAVSTIPILVVYPWLQKYFVKGVMLGSLKG